MINNNIADKVDVVHRYLPQEGGGLGFNQQMEILSRAVDFNTGKCNFTLQFTSYNGLRVGLIAPSPFISNIVSQTTFDVPDGTCYDVGYTIRLFDTLTNDYTADAVATIDSISGNTITVSSAFSTTLLTTHKIKLAGFNEASGLQTARYAYVAPNSGLFDDGSKAYQILF